MARRGAIAALWDAVHLVGKAAMSMLRAPTGESGMARMVGTYGGAPYGGVLSKNEQVQHFRGWNYRCIDYIASRIAKEPPTAVLTVDPREAARHKLKTKAFLLGKGAEPDPRAFAHPMWVRKAHGPAKPNEEYEFLSDDSPLVRLLQDPNDPETGVSVWYELELFICLTGEGYLWIVEGDNGKPAELWVIPSHWVRPVCLGQDLLIDYFEVMPRGGSAGLVRFDPDELIYFKMPNPLSKLIGQSPLQAFSTTIDAYEMTDAARYFSLQNGAMVGGQIQVPPTSQLTPEMIDRLESRFAAKFAGVKNMNRPLIFEGGAQWVPAPPDQELAFMQSLDQLRKYVIGGLWGLDESVIGFASIPSRAGMVAAIANINENVINPRRRARAATLTEKLARRFDPKARIFYPDDTPLDPDAVRSDFSAAQSGNAVSPNDWRTHVLGLEPWEEDIYDRPLVSPGLMNPGSDAGDWDGDGQPGNAPQGGPQQPDTGANPELGGAIDDGQDPFAGLVDDAQIKAIVGRWFRTKDHGASPFPGGVFDEHRHRWVKPQPGDDPNNVHHASLAEHMPPEVFETPGLWEKVKDAAATVAAKAYTHLVRATPAMLKVMAAAEALFDTPDDLKTKFGYNPTTTAGGEGAPTTNDPLRSATGISTHLACTIASHVLGRASVWARKKVTGKDAVDGWTEAAELIADVLSEVNAALELEGVPDVAKIAAWLRGTASGVKAVKSSARKHGPPPRPGLVFDEGSHRWIRPEQSAGGKPKPTTHPEQQGTPQAVTNAAAPKQPRTQPDPMPERFAKSETGRNLVDANVQRWCEGTNEPAVAKEVGGKALPDNEPMDVVLPPPPDNPSHGLELKTMVANKDRKIVMKASAQARKRAWRRKNKVPVHTVVIDDTQVYNANGPGQHDLSKRRVFYRRGFGSFKVDGMHEVEGGFAGLPALIATPTNKLPPGAWKPKPAATKGNPDITAKHGPPPFPGAVLSGDPPRWHVPSHDEARQTPGGVGPDSPAATHSPATQNHTDHDDHHETAAKWVAASPNISPETAARYTHAMAGVLRNMTPACRKAAMESLAPRKYGESGGVTFHPDIKAVQADFGKGGGGVVGFVRHRKDEDWAKMVLDGDGKEGTNNPEYTAAGVYAHELGHCVDVGRKYSTDPKWESAWKREIFNGKTLLSRYARENPTEGFAELHRAIVQNGVEKVKALFPKTVGYFESKGLV